MTLSEKRARAGRRGGIATATRHCGMHRVWGQQGGRPLSLPLAEIRAQERRREVTRTTPHSVRELLREYKEGDTGAYGSKAIAKEFGSKSGKKGEPR